jgi:hypothetical protein
MLEAIWIRACSTTIASRSRRRVQLSVGRLQMSRLVPEKMSHIKSSEEVGGAEPVKSDVTPLQTK